MSQFKKRFEDLDFSDNFIFCKVMQNEEICKEMIKILLDIDVEKIEYLQTEKSIENLYDARGIRMDVFVKDSNRVFDLEMQTGNYSDMFLRARYYQSVVDMSIVPRRTKFKDLKESYIVFICKNDPFGVGLPKYTRKTFFAETDSLSYNDKSHIVFYNASGYEKETNPERKNLLRFICNLKAESEFTKKVQHSVVSEKTNELIRKEFMTVQDIIDEEVETAEEKGKLEALAQTAKAMLAEKCDIALIAKVTGLSEQQILSLK